MKKVMKMVPALRFSEFEGEWNNRIVDELVNVIDCKHRTPPYTELGIPVVSPGSIKWGEIDLKSPTKRVTEEEYQSLMDHCSPKYGDMVFSRNQSIGIASILLKKEKFVLGQDTVLIQAKKVDPFFIYFRLQTSAVQTHIKRISGGSTFSRINLKDIRTLKMRITPFLPEQQKIATFLTAVDEKIQRLTRKKELLEQYKKGVMQKIFKQEIRFKDDAGKEFPEWEERLLGEVGFTFNGLTGKTKDDFGKGKPYIQYKQIFDDSKINISKVDLVEISKDERQRKVQYGDVFFTTSSETPKEIGFSSVLLDDVDEMYLNSFCFGYRTSSKYLCPEFSRFIFRSSIFRRNIIKLAQGSTRYNMSKIELMKLTIHLPSLPEQQKIANFLTGLDDKIAHTGVQLARAQEWKKGLLQGLFV